MPIDTVVTDDKAPTAPMGALPFLPVIPPLDLQRVGMVACQVGALRKVMTLHCTVYPSCCLLLICQHPSFWFCAWLHAAKLQAENGTLRTTIEELVPRFFFKALNTLLVQGAQPAVPGFPPSAYVSPAKSALGSELLRLLQLSGPSQQGDHDVIRFVQTHEHPVKVLEQALARAKLLPRSELVVTSHRDLIKESLRKSNAALRFLLYPYTAVSLPVPTNLAYASSPPFSGTPAAWSQSVAGFSHPAMQHQLRLHHQQQQQQQQQQRQQKQQHQQQKQQQQLMLQELQRRQRGNRRDPRSSNNTAEERSSTATGTVGASTLHHGHPPYFSFGSPRAWSGAPAVSMHMPPGMPFGALVPMRTGAPGLFHGETPWPFDPTRTPPQKAGGAHGAVASGTRRSESVRSADSRALHGSPTVQHAEKLPHTAVGSDGAPPAKRPRLRVSSVDNEVGRSLVAMAHSKTAGADARMSTSLHPSGVAGIKDDEPWPPVNTIGDLFAVGSSSSTQDRKCMLCSTDRVRGRLPLNFVESYSSTAAPVGLWWLCHRCGLFLRRHYGCSGYQTHVKCGPRAIRPKCRKKLENIQRMTGLRLKRPPSPASASNKVPGSDGSEAGDIVVDTSQAPHRSKGRVTRGTSKRLSSPST